jgi:hypothetical protein
LRHCYVDNADVHHYHETSQHHSTGSVALYI